MQTSAPQAMSSGCEGNPELELESEAGRRRARSRENAQGTATNGAGSYWHAVLSIFSHCRYGENLTNRRRVLSARCDTRSYNSAANSARALGRKVDLLCQSGPH